MAPLERAFASSRKRREMRFPVEGVRGSLKSPGDLRIINVSRSGLSFATMHHLTVGDHYFIEIRYQGQTANLELELRWCFWQPETGDAEPPIFLAGGRFVDIVRDDPDGLWRGLAAPLDQPD
ncbi:MAG: PilZ domain-containing protein [Acidobacteriota bacterium]